MRAAIAGLIVVLGTTAPACAASGVVSAAIETGGYARMVFSFDRLPKATAKLMNSVLVVSFAEPVTLDAGSLARGLGDLVGVVRRDPDGTAIRIALQKPVKLLTTEAGEKLFVDLLPTNWSGLPPPLPLDVIAELTREVREARDVEAQEARRRARPDRTLTLDGATHPTFRRLIFRLGGEAPVDFKRIGDKVAVTIDAPYVFDVAAARASLPTEFAGLSAERKDGRLVITIPVAGGPPRGFQEDDDFVLDVDRTDAAPGATDDDHSASDAHAPDAHAAAPSPSAPPVADAHAPTPPAPAAAQTAHAEAPAKAPAPAPVDPHGAPPPAAVVQAQAASAPSVAKDGETLRLTFPFARSTAAAVFARGRSVWVVFDDTAPLNLPALKDGSGGVIAAADEIAVERGRAARLKLAQPRLVTASVDGSNWVVSLGDNVLQRSGEVELKPKYDAQGRAAIAAEAPGLGAVRTLHDPDVGDDLTVATLGAPARNLPRPQSFVEFSALATAQGFAFQLMADDVRVAARLEELSIERDAGLTLSIASATAAAGPSSKDADPEQSIVLNAASWREEVEPPFSDREHQLMAGAALAAPDDRPVARLALAKFYIARDRAAEAKAVLDATVEDGGLPERDERLAILRAATEVELNRPQAALAILSSPAIRMKPEAALWRASAEAAAGRSGPARTALRQGAPALKSLPDALRARFVGLDVGLALDAGDVGAASAAFDTLDVLPAVDGVAARDLLRARLAEGLGKTQKALAAYATIAKPQDSATSAEAELRSIELGLKTGALPTTDAIARLERLTTGWRGDQIEGAALARLIGLYGDAGRWREAFSTLRNAVEAFPDADGTRALQDKMQERFTDLFLGAGLDSLNKLDALALFYDFKELSPGGKRGDELVRRLADKLVDVDLLDQAADLLAYQIDNRLTGAARAQVAARAALVDMMNGKPARALETLRKTRQADLPASLMQNRLRLEARALAGTGRVDLALEMADGLAGPESNRLKADILWSARRWPEAGEAIEAALGSSWRGPRALDADQRSDVMRAAIALSLADDGLGVDRLRQKFSAKMADSPEASGFEVVTAPVEARGDAFREVARSVAASASFDDFLREYRKRGAEEAAAGNRPDAPAKPGQGPSRA